MTPTDQVTPTYTIPKGDGQAAYWYVPPSAGIWRISGSFCIHVAKRPRWLTRKLMWWLVEWKWEDA